MGERTDQDLIDRIRFLAVQGLRPPKIEDDLSDDSKFRMRVPDIRTIQRYSRGARPVTTDWSFLPAGKSVARARTQARPSDADRSPLTPEDAALAMETIGRVLNVTDGRVAWLGDDEARLIIWLRKAFPRPYGIGPLLAYLIANEYLRPGSNHKAVDAALAIRHAWMTFVHGAILWKQNYRHAVKEGWIPAAPDWMDKEEHELWNVLRQFVPRRAGPNAGEAGQPDQREAPVKGTGR
jgi:hypothetical protein